MKYSDDPFSHMHPRTNHGLARLPREQQRHRLKQDTRHWLETGHHISQLPPGPVTAAGRLDSFSNLLLETGFMYEL